MKNMVIEMNWRKLNIDSMKQYLINSLWPGYTTWHQWTRSSLVQCMACYLLIAKLLPEPMMTCELDPWEHMLGKF